MSKTPTTPPPQDMQVACVPADEGTRLETLRNLGLLDSAPAESFDRATRLAAALLRVPIVLVSLVDENRQWFKSKIGLDATETSREVSFCAHAVFNRAPLVVPNATRDVRFAGNPLVTGAPHIRAYLGIPIFSKEGHALGTLCAIDTEVHAFTQEDTRHLMDCTKVIEELIHSQEIFRSTNALLRLATEQEEKILAQEKHFRFLADAVPQMVWTARPDGFAEYYNQQWFAYTGMSSQQTESGEWGPIHPDDVQNSQRVWARSVATGEPYQVEHRFKRISDGTYRWHLCRAVRLKDETGNTVKWFGTCTDFHDYKEAEAKNLSLQAELEDRVRQRTAQLAASEDFLDRAGQIAGIGAWSFDLETQEIRWSDRTCLIHEVDIGHVPVLEDALTFYSPESRLIIEAAMQDCIGSGVPYDLELSMVTAKCRSIWIRVAGELETRQGKAIRMFGVFQDITTRKAAELESIAQHELIRVTLESIGDAVITTDAHGAVQWLNPVAAKMTGWPIEEARGQSADKVFKILNEATRKPVSSPVLRALAEDSVVGLLEHTVLVSRDGTEYGIQDSASPIRNDEGHSLGVVLVFHDVSEQRRLAKEVNFRASHDALTGLVNRAEFEIRLKHALVTAREQESGHALLFIDLDQFKMVNDACGHAVGDQLLRQVSAIFKNIVRSRDTLARLGGDEFGVILEQCTVIQARRVAAQLCESMENFRFTHDEQRFQIGASIGLVPMDGRWFDSAALMQAADASCYAAKEAGRNRVHEWVETDERMKERQWEMQWAHRLEEALDENKFQLYAQRLAGCSTRMPGLSIEILLRLGRPDGSIIAPSAFLPAAERFHMASRIDRWVVREVIQWMRSHPLDGVDSIAVNLSAQSIGDRSFHRFVAELVSSVSFDLRKLCFEITETAAITNMGDAAEFIDAMRAFGIRIALDDFGAGASSFGYLKNLRVDILKIDGQFVRDLLHDRLDHTAVCCFRDVAAVTGLTTVAEFVESEDVLAELRRIGIDFAQGFLIHRPEPLENLFASRTVIELNSKSKVSRLAAR